MDTDGDGLVMARKSAPSRSDPPRLRWRVGPDQPGLDDDGLTDRAELHG